ncbi:3',5'-bisphosphate nucleotidase [Drechmeria coniospora]|uniref:3',5'-bisphosphate nucleotidase n=1 Tax=Drechmeria coniospora TaxID=98403 RepID=A0A151GM89_DRECN|nr:3',5'-bisphosphate nucleotidase [Drechmeria coniospora]KYK58216.1 3',5'-bisphosphate nucleotidase [Drechmeria coniospora]
MSALPWHRELQVAQEAVVRAARLTKGVLSTVTQVSKEDASPVTVADFAAQALLISILRDAFPGVGFVGEEDSAVLRADDRLLARVFELFSAAAGGVHSVQEMLDLIDLGGRGTGGSEGRYFVMDPVDGTAAFLKGEQYAVSLALVQDGQEMLAVVAYPNLKLDAAGRIRESSIDTDGLGIMLFAVAGQGAHMAVLSSADARLEPSPLPQLQPPSTPADTHIVDCDLNRASSRATMRELATRLGAPFPGTDVWSSHVRYAALIIGGGDVLIRIPSKERSRSCIWDHVGAQLIFRELGGVVTDLDGRPMNFGAGRYLSENRGLLAAKKEIHEQVLLLARELIPDPERPAPAA